MKNSTKEKAASSETIKRASRSSWWTLPPDAIIGKDLDGVVTHWDKGAEQMYGYTAAEIIGKPVSTLAPPDRANEIPEILRKIRHGERVDYFESVRITKDKRQLNVSISISPYTVQRERLWGHPLSRATSPHRRRSKNSFANRKKWKRSSG